MDPISRSAKPFCQGYRGATGFVPNSHGKEALLARGNSAHRVTKVRQDVLRLVEAIRRLRRWTLIRHHCIEALIWEL
jgi:hypothetical protein